jgi:Uncharacterized protein conserved in bacteria
MKRIPLLPVLLLACGPALLPAQAATPPAPSAEPVETVIESQHAELWSNNDDTETNLLLRGNVVVTATNLRITCDRIDAVLEGENAPARPAAEQGTADDIERFKSIVATGKVRILQGQREAHCERAEILPREGKVVLTGAEGQPPVIMDHDFKVTWIADPAILLKGERRVLGENVRIVGPAIKDLGFDKNASSSQSDASSGQ